MYLNYFPIKGSKLVIDSICFNMTSQMNSKILLKLDALTRKMQHLWLLGKNSVAIQHKWAYITLADIVSQLRHAHLVTRIGHAWYLVYQKPFPLAAGEVWNWPSLVHSTPHVSGWQLMTVSCFSSPFIFSFKYSDWLVILSEQLAQGGTAVGTGLNTKKGYE